MRVLIRTAVVVALCVLAAEAALRVHAALDGDAPLFVTDAAVGHRQRPGATIAGMRMNSAGFNDADRRPAPVPGLRRVALIGDSFVFGSTARADNAASALQRLADRNQAQVEIVNLGIIGAGPRNYRALIEGDAARLGASVAVVVLFLGNDVVETHPDFRTRVWLGAPRVVVARPWTIGASVEHLMLYRVGRGTVRQVADRLASDRGGTFGRWSYLDLERQRAAIFQRSPNRFVEDSYAATIAAMIEVRDAARRHGMALFVALAPDELQVDGALREAAAIAPAAYDVDAYRDRLARPLADAGIDLIDLTPIMRAAGTPQYLPRDSHWNAAGNRLAAAAIWSRIEATLLP